jgi:hypothetical protein
VGLDPGSGAESYTDPLNTTTRTGSITGTSTESGHYASSSNNSYAQTLGSDGNWSITDGAGTSTVASADSSTYSGTGHYSDSLAGYSVSDLGSNTQSGSLSGSITESGYSDSSTHQSVGADWDGVSRCVLVCGEAR